MTFGILAVMLIMLITLAYHTLMNVAEKIIEFKKRREEIVPDRFVAKTKQIKDESPDDKEKMS